jgi:hypothetical protein
MCQVHLQSKGYHAEGVKHIIRYLSGTMKQGLVFSPDKDMKLDCYVDANFAGLWKYEEDQDPVCVKYSGYVFTLGGCPLTWSLKLQTKVAFSHWKLNTLLCPKPCESSFP